MLYEVITGSDANLILPERELENQGIAALRDAVPQSSDHVAVPAETAHVAGQRVPGTQR